MNTQYNKLAMSWHVGIVNEEKVLAIIETHGGEFEYRSQMGRGALALVEFSNDEMTQSCLVELEKLEMHVELFVPTKVNLN